MLNKSLSKRLEYCKILAHLIRDVHKHMDWECTPRWAALETLAVEKASQGEGVSFFTKNLPRLGKALDKALASDDPFALPRGFHKLQGSELPKLFGELFKRVFALDGRVLTIPCVDSVRHLRQLCYLFYKYELPYEPVLETQVVSSFVEVDKEVSYDSSYLSQLTGGLLEYTEAVHCQADKHGKELAQAVFKARALLARLFQGFKLEGLNPRHGPGVVSTKEDTHQKYGFTRINPRIQTVFPFDEFYFVNVNHLSDRYDQVERLDVKESHAKVCLVPKDSRGPRIISCEPLENQWFQQGIMQKVVSWVERHPLSRDDVRFTNQEINRMAALAGSYHGELVTLDLKEASDRVSTWLVERLFPEPLLGALLATRTQCTVLPTGEQIKLNKFAPMGSACCFPVLALTVWALLRSHLPINADSGCKATVLVYGDDVIVDKANAVNAMEQLEAFGLHVNRDKSCISGLFRESCGMDAYNGVDVTPVRLRTVWSSKPNPAPYVSFIAYANELYNKGYKNTAKYLGELLEAVYGVIPCIRASDQEEDYFKSNKTKVIIGQYVKLGSSCDAATKWLSTTTTVSHRQAVALWHSVVAERGKSFPHLRFLYRDAIRLPRIRLNISLQRCEAKVRVIRSRPYHPPQDGWEQLLRYFVEKAPALQQMEIQCGGTLQKIRDVYDISPSPASEYTRRGTVNSVTAWR